MPRSEDGCVSVARGPIAEKAPGEAAAVRREEAGVMMARVGGKAPDFEASALIGGGFKNLKLSDYLGHWVVLCFYPGDFTFV